MYTKLCKSAEKSKNKYFRRPRNNPLIFIDYWLNNIEEYFYLPNPDNISLSDKYTTQDVKM